MVVHGMNQLAQMQLMVGIYPFYSGAEQTDVHGVNPLVKVQLAVGI
jgi:hypothetical protein